MHNNKHLTKEAFLQVCEDLRWITCISVKLFEFFDLDLFKSGVWGPGIFNKFVD